MKERIGAVIFLVVVTLVSLVIIYGREKAKREVGGNLHQAKFYQKDLGGIVTCELCPNRCVLSDGQIGTCRARINIKGELYSLVYGKIASMHVDPIEKKPFFHVLPGTNAFSIATAGCNLQCKFCQNWQISQFFPWETQSIYMTPQEVVDSAVKSGANSIAYTYSEPTIFIEYIMDIAKLAHERGLKNVVVSAGFINEEPLRELLKYVDAMKIDFKGFSEKFYEKMTNGHLEPVLKTMKIIKESGVWLEIVNLVVPTENDSDEEIKGLINWVKENLGDSVPLHFTRFHPDYMIQNLPPTPLETMQKARDMALSAGLKYVYTGNVGDSDSESTYCPISKEKVIERKGFFVLSNDLKSGMCSDGEKIPGVWQ